MKEEITIDMPLEAGDVVEEDGKKKKTIKMSAKNNTARKLELRSKAAQSTTVRLSALLGIGANLTIIYVLRDIKSEAELMLKDLMEVDTIVGSLQEKVTNESVDNSAIISELKQIRIRIGVLEKEDEKELEQMTPALIEAALDFYDKEMESLE